MSTDETALEQRISAVAALKDPVRRAIYLYAVGHGSSVSRDQAAAAVNVKRAVAAFHLDRLVDEGLLEATFRRPPDRRGPGAGRPPKLYRATRRDLSVAFPPRNYELAAHILRRALTERASLEETRVIRAARKLGRNLGRQTLARVPRSDPEAAMAALTAWLEASGYRPRWSARKLDLENCPFDALIEDCPDVMCSANLGLMEGVTEGLHLEDVKPVLECRRGACCVSFVRDGRT